MPSAKVYIKKKNMVINRYTPHYAPHAFQAVCPWAAERRGMVCGARGDIHPQSNQAVAVTVWDDIPPSL